MKKFTKITLIIAAILAGIGIILCGIATAMSGGFAAMHQNLSQEITFGNWHIGRGGIYYSGADFIGDRYVVDDTEDDWDDDDEDDDTEDDDVSDEWDDDLDNEAVETFGTWILNLVDMKAEPAGTESAKESYQADEVNTMRLQLDVISEVNFKVSPEASEITVEMRNGYKKYFSAEKSGTTLKVGYDSKKHKFQNRPAFIVTLPAQCDNLVLDIVVGAGDINFDSKALTVQGLKISSGVGDMTVNQVTVKENAAFEVGTGDADIVAGSYQKLSIKNGVGDTDFSGDISEKLTITAGTGDISIELPDKQENYQFDLSTGVGCLDLNGKITGSFAANYESDGNGGAKIQAEAGVGDITVSTE